MTEYPSGETEGDMIRRLISELSPDEQEVAAKMSYKYFVASELNHDTSGFSQALQTAIQWFVEAEGGDGTTRGTTANFDKTLKRIRDTIEWRESFRMNDLRKAFDKRFEMPDDQRMELQNKLTATMENGRGYSCGYDTSGVAYIIWHMHEHFVFDDPEWHVKLTFWICERALAATERKINQVKMSFVLDYRFYALRNTMPIRILQRTIVYGLRHYPEFVHKVYLLDTPAIFQAVWIVAQLFIDSSTKAKITFVKGDAARRSILYPVIDFDQAPECLLASEDKPKAGKPPLDLVKYMVETPFDECFGETKH